MAASISTITAAMHEEPSREPLTAIEASFGAVSRGLHALARTQALLDDAQPTSSRFHHLLRALEAAEERIGASLNAVLTGVPATAADQHLRRVARDLRTARSTK